jgi:hypothetical protein
MVFQAAVAFVFKIFLSQ